MVEEIRGVGHVPDIGAGLDLFAAPAVGQHGRGGAEVQAEFTSGADAPEGIGVERGDFALHVEALFLVLRPAGVDEVFGDHDALDAFVVEDPVARVLEFLVDPREGFGEVRVG